MNDLYYNGLELETLIYIPVQLNVDTNGYIQNYLQKYAHPQVSTKRYISFPLSIERAQK